MNFTTPIMPVRPPTRHLILAVGALIGLCLTLYGPPAARTPFFTKGEPREALVVRNMVEGGDWILPRRPAARGWTIASKPPFFHWLGAVTARVTGRTSATAVRLPSVVLATAAVGAVYLAAATTMSAAGAFAGAVVLATTFEWMNAAQSARVDATLAAFMTFALLLFYRGFGTGGMTHAAAVSAYACLAAAALTKGPVGFLVPGLVLGLALVVTGRIREIPRFRPVLGAVVIVGAVGAWYLAAWWLGGDPFFEKHILKENVFRFVGGGEYESGHAHPPYYYFRALAVGFLPWTPVLAAALVAIARRAAARRDPRLVFLLVWFVTTFIFYSAASAKRSVYLLALYPSAALLCGLWLDDVRQMGAPPWLRGRPARAVQGLLCAIVALPLLIALFETLGLDPLALVRPLLRHRDRVNLPIVRSVIVREAPLVLVTLTALVTTLVLACRALADGRWPRAFGATATFAAALWILVFAIFRPAIAEQRSLASFMTIAAARATSSGLSFYPPTFDFGAAFYAPYGVGYLDRSNPPTDRSPYVLIWDVDLAALEPAERATLEVLATSDGTDPKGRRHMLLARLHPTSAAQPDP
jgi:4-amino-4-deoxy-L-arabinose transferase-like glycosyltransferase